MNNASEGTRGFGPRVDPERVSKLLYCPKSRTFLAPDGTWTEKRRSAKSFMTLDSALTEIHALDRPDLVIYYAFGSEEVTEYDFQLTPKSSQADSPQQNRSIP